MSSRGDSAANLALDLALGLGRVAPSRGTSDGLSQQFNTYAGTVDDYTNDVSARDYIRTNAVVATEL